MYKLTYSVEKNRIRIMVSGTLTQQELVDYRNELIDIVNNTRPGFTVFGDVRDCDISFLENYLQLQDIRDYATTRGFKNVAIVMGKEAYEIHQKKPFPGVKNVFIGIKDAEKFLDNLE